MLICHIFQFTELLQRVENGEADSAKDLALTMFRTATFQSGFMLQDSGDYAQDVYKLLGRELGIPEDAEVDEEEDIPEPDASDDDKSQDDIEEHGEEHDEL